VPLRPEVNSVAPPTPTFEWRASVDPEGDAIRYTVELFVEGVLQSAATAANTTGKGKPVRIHFANIGLHGQSSLQTWYHAHVAVLDGVSTIGRRFARRTPAAVGAWDQMAGSLAALADGDIATRVASTAAGQRLSFTLAGPTGPAGGAIAGLHIRQIAQAGSDGPAVLVKIVVACIRSHAARLAGPAMGPPPPASWGSASAAPWPLRPASGRSGLSQTEPMGCQLRVRPDHRSGRAARASS
jgi:hypothetical protein